MNVKQQLIAQLTEANTVELRMNRIHKAVAEFIKTQENKAIDGWFERRAKKYFTENHSWEVRLTRIAGMTYLAVSGGWSGFTMANEARMFLVYDNKPFITSADFEERNISSGSAAEQRINERNILLNDEQWLNQAQMRIEVFQQAKKALEEFMGDRGPTGHGNKGNEAFYIIRDLAGLDPRK
jgi:hypothetical protein